MLSANAVMLSVSKQHVVSRTTFEQIVPVRAPFRLDYTVDALRRLSSNAVDRTDENGAYMRALQDDAGTAIVRVTQPSARDVLVRVEGERGARFVPVVRRMLGTDVDLRPWYAAVKRVPWLAAFEKTVHGVKPPRYPTMWEALCHAIIFQQISIHAAGAIMHRMVEALGTPVRAGKLTLYPFPQPQAIAAASEAQLRAASLSINKITALQAVARAVQNGEISEPAVERLPTAEASAALCELRGIGPWSAAVVLLRGLGRLDAFPLRDSGVAASLRLLRGNHEAVDVDRLLATLGDQRGMLYFHLLLGRIASRRATAATPSGL